MLEPTLRLGFLSPTRWGRGGREAAGEGDFLFGTCIDAWASWRVYGMVLLRQRPCRLAFLHHRAAAQDGDAVGHVGDHGKVVRDQQQPHAVLVDEVAQQFQDLLLQDDVERGGRLVGDQQLRLQRAGDRNDDALALAAGQLVRIARQRKFVLRQPDPVEHFSGAILRLAPVGAGVPADALGDLLADRLDRVQRRHRLLEDHADVVAA